VFQKCLLLLLLVLLLLPLLLPLILLLLLLLLPYRHNIWLPAAFTGLSCDKPTT
jgi:hypothetical protein